MKCGLSGFLILFAALSLQAAEPQASKKQGTYYGGKATEYPAWFKESFLENNYVLEHAKGVDVLIQEMTTTPEVWTTKQTGLTEGTTYDYLLSLNTEVIENSHTMQRAFGYILSQTDPKLGVATHFPNDPDLIEPALDDIRDFYNGPVILAQDLLVITVSKNGTMSQAYAQVPEYPWYTGEPLKGDLTPSKYDGPLAQFNETLLENVIPAECYK